MLWRAWPFLGGWASSLRARIVATASTTTTSMMLLWMEEAASDCYGHTKRGRAEAFNVATYSYRRPSMIKIGLVTPSGRRLAEVGLESPL